MQSGIDAVYTNENCFTSARFPHSFSLHDMKKIFLGFFILVAAMSAAFVFLKKASVHRSRAADLVPAETIFFAHFPDLRRTAERWPQTALAQIWAEPEMQAFLAKPRAKAPEMKLWQEKLSQIAQVSPGEAFFAITSIDGPQPKMIAGFSFSGRKADVAALLAEPHNALKAAWPAGKSDLATYGGTEIETFTYQNGTVAESFRGDWYFVSNDLDLLHSTLDASTRESNSNSLGAQEVFKQGGARMPGAGDALLFTQLGTLSERLVSLMAASGQPIDAKQISVFKKIRAITWGTKIEGSQWRDTIFVLSPGEKPEAKMSLNTTVLTAPETVLYYASSLPAAMDLPQSTLALTAFIPGLQAMDGALAARGLKWNDFGKAFGPEFGTVMDWLAESAQPSALFALDVRDAAKAKGFAEAFTSGLPGGAEWGRKEEDGVTIYQGLAEGLLSLSPTIALTDRFFLIGLSPETVKQGLARLKRGQAAIVQNGAYQSAAKSVNPPTAIFGFLDLKTFFERSYGTLRPFIAMSLAFNPEAGKYLDASKLPGTETISKHLGPSVYSQSVSPDGTLMESVGPLTFQQILIGGLGGALTAAFPMIENAMAGGLKLDPSLLQMKPGGPAPALPGAPPAPTAPRVPQVPASPVNPPPQGTPPQ
jgi:hypothetical protein